MDYLTYRWTNIVLLFYSTYISVYLAHHEIFCAKVGKGGIMIDTGDTGRARPTARAISTSIRRR